MKQVLKIRGGTGSQGNIVHQELKFERKPKIYNKSNKTMMKLEKILLLFRYVQEEIMT